MSENARVGRKHRNKQKMHIVHLLHIYPKKVEPIYKMNSFITCFHDNTAHIYNICKSTLDTFVEKRTIKMT